MPENILTIFRRNALRLGNAPCLHYKKKNVWIHLSWVDAEDTVRRYALGLAALGLKAGGRVALLSKTRVEWTLLDMSVLANQAITVPLYHTLAAEQIAFILKDCKPSLLILENPAQWERLKPHLSHWNSTIVIMDGEETGFVGLKELRERGKSLPVNLYDENLRQIQPIHPATYVYTSGTTGPPKGAILTHRNLLAEIEALQEVFRFGPEQIGFMCLPLAHVIARAMQFYQLAQGCQAAYAESLEMMPVNLLEIKPHFMPGVPRLFEKMHERILNRVQQSPQFLQKLFNWSLNIGSHVSDLQQRKEPLGFVLRVQYFLAGVLIYRKVRRGFGGRIRCLISGGAPLAKPIAQFFHALGILLIEGYGLTETSAAVTLNRLDDFRFGTVGKPLEGVRIKINPDGEICIKGDTVFAGYLNLKEDTMAAFDKEGWFLTGDIGEFTKDGFLRITDRKKDIIATSGGKKISPQNIENMMQQSRYIQQIMVYGDQQKFLSALVTLNWEVVEDYAKKNGITFKSRKDMAENPDIYKLVQTEIAEQNKHLSSFETIKKFAILDTNFSVESGELTPTLKVKRKIVTEKYKNILQQLYLDS
ncbi:MAG: long-chain fatty acid--CoA ligase [Deltaproteobacteria bacterium]|nr:long-chain fatty acid--CoA ligase [Deltaproteobacteria bacterium]